MNARQATARIPAGSWAAPKVAWLLSGLALVLIACGAGFMVLGGSSPWAVIRLLALVSSALMGGLVASRRPGNPVGWFLLIFAVCLAVVVSTEAYAKYGLRIEPDSLPLARAMAWPPQWLGALGAVMILLFLPLYFPDGRLVSRRWRWVVWFAAFFSVFATVLPAIQPGDVKGTGLVNPMGIEALGSLPWVIDLAMLPLWLGLLFVSAASLVVRFRRSGIVQRQQIKWLAFAASAIPVWFIASPLVQETVPVLFEIGETLAFAGVPVAVGIAILRYRLYDIDLIINRALVYGALTACVVALYVLVVGYLGQIFRTNDDLLISLVATGLVAVLFAPLRDRLQRSVNRLLYGERDDPYAVISRLGERLEGTLAPDAVLPAIVQTVREALKLPYAAIALGEGDEPVIATDHGSPVGNLLRLPLVYQGETVGELLLAPRGPGEEFSAADRRLLDGLARQAGVAVHAVRLTDDLQRSRERLVSTREEERRRLRRDLHDGLGPTLSSLPLKLDVADDLLERDPPAARALLRGLKSQAQSAIVDIRRLVYALRPPALDDLGLVGAIGEAVAQCGTNGLLVSVEVPEKLPSLPAAVEVAVYRIAQEAMTNVARHARARNCSVRLSLDEAAGGLLLEIVDNGCGIPEERERGVGIVSMRERAVELGGSVAVGPASGGGTVVRALLPLSQVPDYGPTRDRPLRADA